MVSGGGRKNVFGRCFGRSRGKKRSSHFLGSCFACRRTKKKSHLFSKWLMTCRSSFPSCRREYHTHKHGGGGRGATEQGAVCLGEIVQGRYVGESALWSPVVAGALFFPPGRNRRSLPDPAFCLRFLSETHLCVFLRRFFCSVRPFFLAPWPNRWSLQPFFF